MTNHNATAPTGSQHGDGPKTPAAGLAADRRRQRRRRRWGLAGTAAAVAIVLAVAVVAVQRSLFSDSNSATTLGISQHLPGTVPKTATLAGRWYWVTATPPKDPGSSMKPSVLTLLRHSTSNPSVVFGNGDLGWAASVGCNNFASGDLHLSPEGVTTTSHVLVSGLGCREAPPAGQTYIPTILSRATWVRLLHGRLDLFNASGHLIASFRRLG